MTALTLPLDHPAAPADGTTAPFTVTVPGTPIPQGSMKVIRGRIISDNPRLAAWRKTVTAVVRAACTWPQPLAGPVTVDLLFLVPQVTSAPKSWRTKTRWLWPIRRSSGDLDKLIRAVFDAVTDAGNVWIDDAQVTDIGEVKKRFAGTPGFPGQPGVQISIRAAVE
jgi:Holliday junction resolvase RusA-like endonuclease